MSSMRTILKLISAGAALAGGLGACASGPVPVPEPVRVERELFAMGTALRLHAEVADARAGMAALEAAYEEVARLEGVLSSWRAETAMSRLNRAPVGEPVDVTPELFELLAEAEAWSEATGRAFEPAIGPLIDAWGLRGSGRRPTRGEIDSALVAVRAGFHFDPELRQAVRGHPRGWMDAGGYGKGAALRAAGRVLRERGVGAALLDFGGQVLALGAPTGEPGWRIGVAHPAQREQTVAELMIRDASVATSGASQRFVQVDGERLGHLLDPRTGRPAAAWGSVTVVAGDALAADALATGLYVLGPERAMDWARGREDVGVLVLEQGDGGVVPRHNDAMRHWLRPAPTEAMNGYSTNGANR